MAHLLLIASWWCGERQTTLVFEPLLADWQHDLQTAKQRGGVQYARAFVWGLAAYVRTLVRCTMTRGWIPTRRAGGIVALTMVVALGAAVALLWLMAAAARPAGIDAAQMQYFLLAATGVTVPPMLLPGLFLMRRETQTTARHAATAISAGALLTAATVMLTTPERLHAHFSTFEAFERRYQRTLANDRAGRVSYPGTALRERSAPTTIEERRQRYEQFMAWRAEQEANRPALTWPQLLRRYYPVALAVLFGIIGWTLAGLGAPTYLRAAMWWCAMFAALMVFGVKPVPIGLPSIGRIPGPMALTFFAVVATALIIASWRRTDESRVFRLR